MNSLRFPHPLVLLTGFILLAAALTYVLPAGEFVRHFDPATQRELIVPGSYHPVPATPVGPLALLVALPKGLAAAAPVVFLIFLAGGAFTVVDQTGALRYGVDGLLRHAQGREVLVIPLVSVLFATMGALENMGEEVIALVPVLLVLMRRLGYPSLTAVAASLGAAIVGAAFSPINPFQVVIAQKLAQLPAFSGWAFRSVFLAVALGIWIIGTLRHARRHQVAPDRAVADVVEDTNSALTSASSQRLLRIIFLLSLAILLARQIVIPVIGEFKQSELPLSALWLVPAFIPFAYFVLKASRQTLVLVLVLVTFGVFAYGVVALKWDFEQMAALFFGLGVGAGLLGGRGLTGTAEGFVAGFRDMAFSGMLVGFAQAIFVVLGQGHVVDTIVRGLAAPLAHLPVAAAALGMMAVHTALHLPVPSVSGQAVLTMPLLVPLSDLLGLSRQVTVLAYQYAAGLADLLTLTNGALMAMLAACGVRFDQWLRFAGRLYGLLLALGVAGVVLAIVVGL